MQFCLYVNTLTVQFLRKGYMDNWMWLPVSRLACTVVDWHATRRVRWVCRSGEGARIEARPPRVRRLHRPADCRTVSAFHRVPTPPSVYYLPSACLCVGPVEKSPRWMCCGTPVYYYRSLASHWTDPCGTPIQYRFACIRVRIIINKTK